MKDVIIALENKQKIYSDMLTDVIGEIYDVHNVPDADYLKFLINEENSLRSILEANNKLLKELKAEIN